MKNGFKVIDGDGHMQEPMDIWENYTEAAFKERIPRVNGHAGRIEFSYAPCEIFPEGFETAYTGETYTGMEEHYGEAFRSWWSLPTRLQHMEEEGVDVQVCFPTNGALATSNAVKDIYLQAALVRAYNDWATDFCHGSSGRVLFVAQATFPAKMDNLFPDEVRRKRAQRIGSTIRHSIEQYISVQTVVSLIQTVISYIAMVSVGLDNALFWALVIFILNYIPIVGGFAAVALPVIFGLVQFESLTRVFILGGVLFGAQFIVANTLQPKMMGDSMNMSALVVVLSLTLWGALWGGVGAFLSAPMTVILMIILAQFPTTRWIAVLLSADGEPDVNGDGKADKSPMPSL